MTVVMAVFLFIKKKGVRTLYNKNLSHHFIYVFFLFVLVAILTLLLNGQLIDYNFPKTILAYYFPSVIVLLSINHHVDSEVKLVHLIFFLMVIMIINSLVSVLQFIGNPIGKAIALLLITETESREIIMYDAGVDFSKIYGGEGFAFGLMSSTFTNANWLATIGVLSSAMVFYYKKFKNRIIAISIVALFLITCIMTQGRAPAMAFLFSIFIILLKAPISKKYKSAIMVLIFMAIILYVPSLVESGVLGRIGENQSLDSDSRAGIWPLCIDFIISHPLGGPVLFSAIEPRGAHNYFLGSLINFGYVGGLIAIYLYFYVIRLAIKILLSNKSFFAISSALALLTYQLNSLAHNASIVSGDALFFIIFGLMLKSQLFERINKRKVAQMKDYHQGSIIMI